MKSTKCTVKDCQNFEYAIGMCGKHYQRFKKYGDPHAGNGNHAPPSERFWRRVNKAGPDDCWLWTGCPTNAGYGLFQLGGKGTRNVLAHRFACEDAGTPIPEGYCVMHTCDVRLCCNPAHLRPGTQSENNRDMYTKGRSTRKTPIGEANKLSVLTEENVRYIRAHPEMSHAALARHFGVGSNTVRGVRIGRTWAHLK